MTTTNDSARATVLDTPAVQSLIETNPDVLLVDVRTPGEYETTHIAGSINLPLDKVNAHWRRIVNAAGRRLVLVCQSGARATQAQHKLTAAGLTDVAVLTGGMNAWMAADAPVERSGKARWALDRQVRFVAGGIVLAAVLASIWFPALRYIAGLIGAGLFFSGVTNFCLMAILLSKLPYNRGPAVDVDAAIARMAAPERRGTRYAPSRRTRGRVRAPGHTPVEAEQAEGPGGLHDPYSRPSDRDRKGTPGDGRRDGVAGCSASRVGRVHRARPGRGRRRAGAADRDHRRPRADAPRGAATAPGRGGPGPARASPGADPAPARPSSTPL